MYIAIDIDVAMLMLYVNTDSRSLDINVSFII